MLRIAFLEGSPSLRARHVLPILTKQFKITYITSGDDIPQGTYEDVIRFPKAKVDMQHAWAYSRLADRLYQEGKIDFVYTYHAIGCFIRKAPQIALFGASFLESWKLSFHWIPWYKRPKLAIGYLHYVVPEIMTCRQAKRILAISEALQLQFIELHRLPKNKVGIVHNGVTQEAFNYFSGETIWESTDLLYVGRLHPRKGILPIVEEFSRRRHMQNKFYLAGDGPLSNEIKRIAEKDKRIVLLGHLKQSEVFAWMRQTAYFIWPTLHEGFGNALAEAMASGQICFYYDIPINREVAGDTGCAIPVNRTDLLFDAIEDFSNKPVEKDRLSVAAHKRARQFTWQACAENLACEFERFGSECV
jgi:glycosyltransferase involved in cell wall biosynthesis